MYLDCQSCEVNPNPNPKWCWKVQCHCYKVVWFRKTSIHDHIKVIRAQKVTVWYWQSCTETLGHQWTTYKSHNLQTHNDVLKKLTSLNSSIIHKFKLLSSQFSQSSVAVEERSRKTSQKKDQRNKKIKRNGEKQPYNHRTRAPSPHPLSFQDPFFTSCLPVADKLHKNCQLVPKH